MADKALAQGLSSGQFKSEDVLKAAATAFATAGASLVTTTAVNVGVERLVSWARDDSVMKSPGFGSQLGEASQKTSKVVKEASVYKAAQDVNEYIRKGDQFYIDKYHMNHIEVFDANNKARAVLNLDGSLNQAKTTVALNQGRTIPK